MSSAGQLDVDHLCHKCFSASVRRLTSEGFGDDGGQEAAHREASPGGGAGGDN